MYSGGAHTHTHTHGAQVTPVPNPCLHSALTGISAGGQGASQCSGWVLVALLFVIFQQQPQRTHLSRGLVRGREEPRSAGVRAGGADNCHQPPGEQSARW